MNTLKVYEEGKCLEMCPKQEMRLREREKLLHVLEMMPGTENDKLPKADRNRIVKCFSRSAAGKTINVEDLRPPSVLLQTVSYLLFDVIDVNCLPWHKVYDFITDRLMSVRQDLVIQNASKASSIAILQPIVKFHAYAAYRLCHESIDNFDPVLNMKHLQETLKRLLSMYDACDELFNRLSPLKPAKYDDYLMANRAELESLYILINLGNEVALRRVLILPKECKGNLVKLSFKISLCYTYGNFVRMTKLIKKLPTLLAAAVSLHLPQIRRKALQIMSSAYNSKQLAFPLETLKEILLYGSNEELIEDCEYYGIAVNGENVYFVKRSFDFQKKTVSPRYELFVENKFVKEDIQSLILCK